MYKNKIKYLIILLALSTGKLSLAEQNITITNVGEAHGLELGDNSYSRGKGSVVTSKNGVAIGSGAVATGGDNLSGDDIKRKLKENETKLKEISDKQKEIETLTNQIKEKRIRERETIKAGIIVEELRKAKATAQEQANQLKQQWVTETSNSENFFKEHQAKIDNLNSRLTGIGNLTNTDISSEEGLQKAVTEFKEKVEKGTTLNLSTDFYKDYITTYYKALGDLRNKKIERLEILRKSLNNSQSVGKSYIGKNSYFLIDDIKDIDRGFTFDGKFGSTDNHVFSHEPFKNNIKYKVNKDIKIIDESVDVVNDEELKSTEEQILLYKKAFREYIEDCDNRFFTHEIKEKTIKIMEEKLDITLIKHKIANAQYNYEKTNNTKYLDEKKQKLDELKNKIMQFKNKLYEMEQTENTPHQMMHLEFLKWEKENIIDVEEKNKITTEKLTTELEQALGINKNAILEREAKLKKMKEDYEQAKRNADGFNPSEKDLILSREYERVKKELDQLNENLVAANARLKALKDALTLHDLKNKGRDNFAQGTYALAIGDDAYAIGTKASAIGEQTLSIGKEATTIGKKSGTIGVTSTTNGENSYTLGNENIVYGNSNITIGNKNKVGKDKDNIVSYNIVIGSNITSTVNNAIVFGNESKPVEGAVSFGNDTTTRQLKFVAEGTDDTDAVNLRQLKKYVGTELGKITLKQGNDGKSAYDVWKEYQKEKGITNDEELTKEKYFEALKGDKGTDGLNGKSAYELWLDKNHKSDSDTSKKEYENSLKGKDGTNGKDGLSAFDIWKELQKKNNPKVPDSELTENNFLNSLKGKDGKDGTSSNSVFEYVLDDEYGKDVPKTKIVCGEDGKLYKYEDIKGKTYNSITEYGVKDVTSKVNHVTVVTKPMVIGNVADGSVSKNSKEAVNGGQLYTVNKKIDLVDKKVDLATEKSNLAISGVSNAIAVASLPQVNGDYRHNISAAYGYYGNSHAVAVGMSGTTEKKNFMYKINASVNNKGNIGIGAGMGYMFGSQTETSVKDQIFKRLSDLDKKYQYLEKENVARKKDYQIIQEMLGKLIENRRPN